MEAAALTVLLLTASISAHAICISPAGRSAENTIRQAKTVFVATITKAYLDPDFQKVSKGDGRVRLRGWYTVRYDFEVTMPIKGQPTSVPFLTTSALYNDPNSKTFKSAGEESRFVPGDNILVVTSDSEPVPISWLSGCTDSMPWDQQAYEVLKNTNLLPIEDSGGTAKP